MTPDYQRGYKEAFEDMKRATVRRLKATIKDVESLEAFSTSTTTTPLSK